MSSVMERYERAVAEGTAAEIDEALIAVRTERAEEKAQLSVAGLRGEDFATMKPRLSVPATIKGLIAPQSLVGIIGPSNSGKTFFACDLACQCALGPTWRGRKVIPGLVVYGALEGARSARDRFYAWRRRFLSDRPAPLPLRSMTDTINLRELDDARRMIEFIRAAESDHGTAVSMCFIDTLSRAMAGGNENNSDDMGLLIRGADAIRLETGATVVLIHHLGKDESRGARGHNSFYAALDTEITIRVNGDEHIAAVTKQRDLPSGDEFGFRLDVVEIGRDADGDAITSCVVVPTGHVRDERGAPTGKNQTALLSALQEWQRAHPGAQIIASAELRALASARGIDTKRQSEATNGLIKLGWVRACPGGLKFTEGPK